MSFRAKDYAVDWKEVSQQIRRDRAEGRCECTGECGLHPGGRCIERDGQPAKFARGLVVLTTAHLDYEGGPCSCKTETGIKCAHPEHLKAMCQRCHLRVDRPHHQRNAAATRFQKRAVGTLFGEGVDSSDTRE